MANNTKFNRNKYNVWITDGVTTITRLNNGTGLYVGYVWADNQSLAKLYARQMVDDFLSR